MWRSFFFAPSPGITCATKPPALLNARVKARAGLTAAVIEPSSVLSLCPNALHAVHASDSSVPGSSFHLAFSWSTRLDTSARAERF